jgi:hypothetical protein
MNRAPTPIISQPLQEIRNIDQDSPTFRYCRLEVPGMERIYFETTYIILEEQRTQTKVSVRDNPCVTFLLDYFPLDGRIV